MSFGASADLQRVIYDLLSATGSGDALEGIPVVDRFEAGTLPPVYVAIGPERMRDRSTKTSRSAEHRLSITVHSALGGFARIKEIAAAIAERLEGQRPALASGTLCSLRLISVAPARGGSGEERRVEMNFRAFVDDI